MTTQEFFNIARKRAAEISEATKNCPPDPNYYTAFCEGADSFFVSHIQHGHITISGIYINFGGKPLTKQEVLHYIDVEEFYL